jgi:transcriptional regulator with XRE-family HTH domain
MQLQEKIGARIKQIRTDKKITQESVAYSANVDRTYMNHVENGRRNVTLDTLERIVCEGLETSIRDFFNAVEFEKK